GHPIDYDLVDDSPGALPGNVEDDTHLLVLTLLRQVINRRLYLCFDITFARVKVKQLIVVGAHLPWRVWRAPDRVDLFPQLTFRKGFSAVNFNFGDARERAFLDIESNDDAFLID